MRKLPFLKYMFYLTALVFCLTIMPFSQAGIVCSAFAQTNAADSVIVDAASNDDAVANTAKSIKIAAPHFFRYTGFDKAIALAFKKDTGLAIEWSNHNAPELEKYVTSCNADAFLLNNPELERYLVDAKVVKLWKPFLSYELLLVGSQQLAHTLSPNSLLDSLINIVKNKIVFIGQKDSSDEIHLERFFWQLLYVAPYESEWYINPGERLGKEITGLLRVGKAVTIVSNMWWLNYKNHFNDDVVVLTKNDPLLTSQYNILLVNENFCPVANTTGATAFINWLKNDNALELIDHFEYLETNIFKSILLY